MIKNVSIGQKVWYQDVWSQAAECGSVVKVTEIDGVPIATVKWDIGFSDVLLDLLYDTREEVENVVREKENAEVLDIKSRIHNVNELVTYMYHAPLNAEEYTDFATKRAVRELAKELLGLELE